MKLILWGADGTWACVEKGFLDEESPLGVDIHSGVMGSGYCPAELTIKARSDV